MKYFVYILLGYYLDLRKAVNHLQSMYIWLISEMCSWKNMYNLCQPLKKSNLKWYKIKYIFFLSNYDQRTAHGHWANFHMVHLLTRTCELVWLPFEVKEIIYWRYKWQGHP